ncbi:MAG: hypothetical protein HY431_01215 [Candidatus Levybacteria bacterium]|nr:hypothetical protein [Candidatus Levybacteria bacterium]
MSIKQGPVVARARRRVRHFAQTQTITKFALSTVVLLVEAFRDQAAVIAKARAARIASSIRKNVSILVETEEKDIILRKCVVRHQTARGQTMLVPVQVGEQQETMKNSVRKIQISVRAV